MKPAIKMKTALLISLLTLTAASADVSAVNPPVIINSTNFPDDIFREYISENFDTDKDGKLSEAELRPDSDGRLVIDVRRTKVSDLTGLKYFKNLTDLDCSGTYISELDVSRNTKLKNLKCGQSGIRGLDVTQNTELESLDCSNGYWRLVVEEGEKSARLSTVDLSQNKKLKKLDLANAALTEIDVSHNPELVYLNVNLSYLERLDVTNNKKLEELYCTWSFVDPDGGLRKVEQPDISQNKMLRRFSCGQNGLTEIDVSNNPELTYLNCRDNRLSRIDVSNNPKLQGLYCGENELLTLDLSQNKALTELNCEDNKIMKLDLSGYDKLKKVECGGNKLRYLDVSGCEALEELICYKNLLESLDTSECPKLLELNAEGNRLKQVKLFHPARNSKEKHDFRLSGNDLTSIDLSGYGKFDVYISSQYRNIKVKNGIYDLSELEKCGLDPDRITYINGAEYDPKADALVNFTSNEIYYYYKCGNGETEQFNLRADFISDDADKKPFLCADKRYITSSLVWEKLSGAEKYVIERFDERSDKWEVIAETTSNSCTDNKIEEYVYYKYRICAFVNGKKGKYSNVVETGYFDYPD
ncbi:MAG: hypothetical protein ACI4RH_00960 [Huintestinicola sp.]